MLKINDTRETGEKLLSKIECGGFFEFDDVLCRKAHWGDRDLTITTGDNEVVVMQMFTGKLTTLDRDTYVTPISDKQIWLEVED